MAEEILKTFSENYYCDEFRYKVITFAFDKAFSPALKMFLPVFINMLLTLIIWVGLYDMKQEKNNPFNISMLASTSDFTTGNQFMDGMVNALCLIFLIGFVSFVLLTLAIYEFKNIIQAWLSFSLLSVLFGVFSIYIQDFLSIIKIQNQFYLTIAISLIYGSIGSFVFFTKKAPLFLHQIYTVINCAMVSVLYLRSFPESTIWYVLPATILWDIFAVWSPSGPLKRVTERANQYNESILKFMMFTAENDNEEKNIHSNDKKNVDSLDNNEDSEEYNEDITEESYQDSIEESEEDSYNRKNSSDYYDNSSEEDEQENEYYNYLLRINERQNEQCEITTAMDALNDNKSVRLGLGDFIFYSLLIGKSAVDMSLISTIAAIFAILFGLLLTLVFLQKGDIVVPALPISIFLGMVFHFGSLYLIEPFLNDLHANNVVAA
uniref:Presenilin n=1 Tax=Parastrongyloides trichosuri TaxID=131310 RepID=A0A0N4ZSG8_PARTI